MIYRLDDIISVFVSYKGAEIRLKEIQDEAYATIDAVQKVGKLNLTLTADLAVRMGYVGSAFELKDLNSYQRQIKKSLHSLKVSEKEQYEILKIIGDRIRRQLSYDGVMKPVLEFVDGKNSYTIEDRKRILKRLELLFENYQIDSSYDEIVDFLTDESIPVDSAITSGLHRFDYYVKNFSLK